MGKVTGFLEFDRQKEQYEPVEKRLKHFKEFVTPLGAEAAKVQGARCMDCGIPFCHNGCPVNNIIPDFNDLVYRQDWQQALEVLHSTNNFPEFTGKICPAPCEEACTLSINSVPIGIKSIEHAIISKGWDEGWVKPQINAKKTGKTVAVVGSGPAGLACAQQLARAGHAVTVYEKNNRAGGLLRYGIPDFKLDKMHIDRRVAQMEAEGVTFCYNTMVAPEQHEGVLNLAKNHVSKDELLAQFDAVVLSGGAESPRDLPIPGRELKGIYFAMQFLSQQNRRNAGDVVADSIDVKGKKVVVIGGGDTGSDCVGTSNRQGAASVVQLEVMPMPQENPDNKTVWPYWPLKLRTSTSHEEGCEREFSVSTTAFVGENGVLKSIQVVRVEWHNGKMVPISGSEFEIECDFVFLAMGFLHPLQNLLEQFGVSKDTRQNILASTDGANAYATNVEKVFAAGDMRRGQSLVVWAIREGRQCAASVDQYLMGNTALPR